MAATTLVTGACGFIGRYLVARLVEHGVGVRATDRLPAAPPGLLPSGVEYREADLRRPATLGPLFEGEVDRVFHLGAICNFSVAYRELAPVNVQGVDQLTRLALGARIRRFVHVSSTSVYGPYRGTPFTEDAPRAPGDDYGRSKRDGEDVVFARMREGLPATILRPCTVYGPGCTDGAGKAFSRPTSIAAIPGNGRQRLSNVRVEDVAAAALHLVSIDGAVGQVYNLADDSHPTVREVLTLAAQTFGARPPRISLPLELVKVVARVGQLVARWSGKIPDLEYDAVRYLADDYLVDCAKLKGTGFELQYPDFTASMAQLGEWFRASRARP